MSQPIVKPAGRSSRMMTSPPPTGNVCPESKDDSMTTSGVVSGVSRSESSVGSVIRREPRGKVPMVGRDSTDLDCFTERRPIGFEADLEVEVEVEVGWKSTVSPQLPGIDVTFGGSKPGMEETDETSVAGIISD